MPRPFHFILWDDGDEVTHAVPAVNVICDRCRGDGHHDHPAFSNGITSDEWNGPDWDDESREAYMRGGYDVPCEVCGGSGKLTAPDVKACTFAQRRLLVQFRRAERERLHDEACDRRTRYMESGGYDY